MTHLEEAVFTLGIDSIRVTAVKKIKKGNQTKTLMLDIEKNEPKVLGRRG